VNQDEYKDLPAFIIVSPKDIAARAYEMYLDRGASDGFDREDWLRAEQELKRMPARFARTSVQKGTAPSRMVAIKSLNYDEP